MRLNLLIATNSFLILIKAMRCIELLFWSFWSKKVNYDGNKLLKMVFRWSAEPDHGLRHHTSGIVLLLFLLKNLGDNCYDFLNICAKTSASFTNNNHDFVFSRKWPVFFAKTGQNFQNRNHNIAPGPCASQHLPCSPKLPQDDPRLRSRIQVSHFLCPRIPVSLFVLKDPN
jgi:hypothetical protein